MNNLEGLLLILAITYYITRATSVYPANRTCQPKKPTRPTRDCGCGSAPPQCTNEGHYFKKTPRIQKTKYEHFAPHNADSRLGHDSDCKGKFPAVDMGYTISMYRGYSPYSYGYLGRPYGFHRPWWTPKECNFPGRL